MTVRVVRPQLASGTVSAPPSKSYTHRAILVAHYRRQRFRIDGPLLADDTLATLRGVAALGTISVRRPGHWELSPDPEHRPLATRTIECGESGTTLRFLLPAAACHSGPVRFLAARRLRQRPLEPLLAFLRKAGVETRSKGRSSVGVEVTGPMRPVRASLDGSVTSQFLSGLLFALPTLSGPSAIRVTGTAVSQPYIAATLRVLQGHGVAVRRRGSRFDISAPQPYVGTRLRIPGDASSAAYLWAAGALTGGTVSVQGVSESWPQADLAVLPILERMGASVRRGGRAITVSGPIGDPVEVDLTDSPDLFPLVGALAAATPGRTTLRGATHARTKESDRRQETARLAGAMGARVSLTASRLQIDGHSDVRRFAYGGARDHRMVMSAAVGALGADGPSRIGSAECVAKSFPGFWETMGRLTGRPEDLR
jgi:3-phosphoshikimate 1-carboxyvinyltransferase